jgi:hypothetical protein
MKDLVIKLGKVGIPAGVFALIFYVHGLVADRSFWAKQGIPAPSRSVADLIQLGGGLWLQSLFALVSWLGLGLTFRDAWAAVVVYGVLGLAAWELLARCLDYPWSNTGRHVVSLVVAALCLVAAAAAWAGQPAADSQAAAQTAQGFTERFLGVSVACAAAGALLALVTRAQGFVSVRHRWLNALTTERVKKAYVTVGVAVAGLGLAGLLLAWPLLFGRYKQSLTASPVRVVLNAKAPAGFREVLQRLKTSLVGERGDRVLLVVGEDERLLGGPQGVRAKPSVPRIEGSGGGARAGSRRTEGFSASGAPAEPARRPAGIAFAARGPARP